MYFYFKKPKTASGTTIDFDIEKQSSGGLTATLAKYTDAANVLFWANYIESTYGADFAPFGTKFSAQDFIAEGLAAARISSGFTAAVNGEFLDQWRDFKLLELGVKPDNLPAGALNGTGLYNPNGTGSVFIPNIAEFAKNQKYSIWRNGYVAAGGFIALIGATILASRLFIKKGKK